MVKKGPHRSKYVKIGQNNKGPKWSQNSPKMVPKWSQNGPKIVQKWSQKGPKMVPKWSQIGPKVVPEWTLSGPKVVPKWSVHYFIFYSAKKGVATIRAEHGAWSTIGSIRVLMKGSSIRRFRHPEHQNPSIISDYID